MRIFYSSASDPMLLDSGARLNALYGGLVEFLASAQTAVSFAAETSLSPAPYQEFLKGLRLQKAEGPIMLRLSEDRWLELSGSVAHLAEYVSYFKFQKPEEDSHHHPDNANYMARGSLHLVIEADSSWGENNAG